MTGRPGDRTVEINRGSTALYLACTPRDPLFMLILAVGLKAKRLLDVQGQRGITSVLRWNLRLVIFSVDNSRGATPKKKQFWGLGLCSGKCVKF